MSNPLVAPEFGDRIFVEAMHVARRRHRRPVLITLCGAQGSGKSTTARRLVKRLRAEGGRVVAFSLDDFYLTKAERQELARTVHPLLATRGAPGTHDLALLAEVLDALFEAGPDSRVALPQFDKTRDDRRLRDLWSIHHGPVDVILLEGWCMGARPQADAALILPVNSLERNEDAEGVWRRYVNTQLREGYADLFARADCKLMLRAPSFACVAGWRGEQEANLDRSAPGAAGPMTSAELERFIAHYERLTCWLLEDEPADLIAELAADRRTLNWRLGNGDQSLR